MHHINFIIERIDMARIDYGNIYWLWPRTEIVRDIIDTIRVVFKIDVFDAYTIFKNNEYSIERSVTYLYGVKLNFRGGYAVDADSSSVF